MGEKQKMIRCYMTPFLFDRYIKDFLATFGVIISVKIITMEFVQNYIAKSNQRTQGQLNIYILYKTHWRNSG